MTFSQIVYLSLFIALLFPAKSLAQTRDLDVIKSLNEQIIPITTFDPDSNFRDIDFLKQTLKNRDIIALGEATHGTHEFFRYKDRLIRFLVTELSFKAIAFESDFATVQRLDDYINGKTEQIKFTGGFPLIKETRSLLEWLKKHNHSKHDTNKVHIYGLEARGFKNIAKLLITSLPDLSDRNKNPLLKIYNTNHNQLTKKDITDVEEIITALYAQASDKKLSDLHSHYVRLLEQGVNLYLKKMKLGIRDENMFKNASWLQEYAPNKKLIIWAHNGHVSKSNIYFQKPMGQYLHQKYQDKYFVLATDFNHGDVNVFVIKDKVQKLESVYYPPVSSSKGYEYYFSKCKFNNFFIDVNKASKEPILNNFLKQSHEMRAIGGTDKPFNSKLSISSCFDLVAFFNKTAANE